MTTDIETTDQNAAVTRKGRRLSTTRAPRSSARPLRSIGIFSAILALVAGIALPALAASRPSVATADVGEVETLQQAAREEAQSLVVASEDAAAATEDGAVVVQDDNEQLGRGTYSATTPTEIAKKKAEEAARERAEALKKALAQQGSSTASTGNMLAGAALTAPGSGEVRYPIDLSVSRFERGLTSYHNGVDWSGSVGTPIYATAAGVVRVSSEGYFSYGVAVVIDHVIGGQRVSTLYAHMPYGARQVQVGDYVEAGQLIGARGSTGRSTGPHLHYEVRVNDALVDPVAWLANNAG